MPGSSNVLNAPVTTAPRVRDTRSPTETITSGLATRSEYSHSKPQPSEVSFGTEATSPEPGIQELKDRIRDLEEIVSRSTSHAQSLAEKRSNISATNVPKLRGNIDKTRFFGMSHWMNTYDEVWAPITRTEND